MHRRFVVLLLSLLGVLGCTEPEGPWVLKWEDDFAGAAGALPNKANWRFDVGTDWGNAQLEYDTDRASNASLDGAGNLAITARQESFQGRNYTSARITTKGLQEFKYGRFEARIKLPAGRGIWPAFWLLGANIDMVGWPQTGEIDVMEYRGQEPSVVIGSLHGPGYSGGNALTRRFTLEDGRFDAGFHDFTVEWDEDQVKWKVDGKLYHEIKRSYPPGKWVFDHPFYIILNVAVGGGFVGPPDGSTTFPQVMLVDWVRVYQR
jgi:beta-glucanase (GH16 family)